MIADELARDIYDNYLLYIRDNKLIKVCLDFIYNSPVVAYEDERADIITLQRNGKVFVNITFAEIIFDRVSVFLNKDYHVLQKYGSLENHEIYLYIFMCVCLASQQFTDDFINKYEI